MIWAMRIARAIRPRRPPTLPSSSRRARLGPSSVAASGASTLDVRSRLIAGTGIVMLISGILAVWTISPRGTMSPQSDQRIDPPARTTVIAAETEVAGARNHNEATSPCPQISRSYTETLISTRAERLALWDEAMRRDQAWLASLNLNDAQCETQALLAQRATIVAGPDTVTRQIPFTEISEVCPSTGSAPPGANSPAPGLSSPPVVNSASPASMSMSPPAGSTNPLPIGSPGPSTGATLSPPTSA